MASVCINVRVFLGSPDDMAEPRAALARLIRELAREYKPDGVCIEVGDWHNVSGDLGRPQVRIDSVLACSDLVILLLGEKAGRGTLHEFRLASDLHRAGRLQSLMLFVTQKAPVAFLRSARPYILYHTFDSLSALRRRAKPHLRDWLKPFRQVRAIANGIEGNDRLIATLRRDPPADCDEIIMLERHAWTDESIRKRASHAYLNYRALQMGGTACAVNPSEAWLVARFLFDSVRQDRHTDCRDLEFSFEVHQQLARSVCNRWGGRISARQCSAYMSRLRAWLNESRRVFGRARDFAALQLGMCNATDARFLLRDRAISRSEQCPVRFYAIVALGLLRRRDMLMDLIHVFNRERNADLRDAAGHSILALAGVLEEGKDW